MEIRLNQEKMINVYSKPLYLWPKYLTMRSKNPFPILKQTGKQLSLSTYLPRHILKCTILHPMNKRKSKFLSTFSLPFNSSSQRSNQNYPDIFPAKANNNASSHRSNQNYPDIFPAKANNNASSNIAQTLLLDTGRKI